MAPQGGRNNENEEHNIGAPLIGARGIGRIPRRAGANQWRPYRVSVTLFVRRWCHSFLAAGELFQAV